MQWTIPGTVLTGDRSQAHRVEEQFRALFLAGGVSLGQVSSVTGLEPYAIQNWVKRGFLDAPVQKKYSLSQFCRILNINMLRSVLPMEQICGLLAYINGDLRDRSDDLIDDAQLYFLFVRLASDFAVMNDPKGREVHIRALLADYREPVPGARARVEQVLRVMLTAWAAAMLRQLTEEMMFEINSKGE